MFYCLKNSKQQIQDILDKLNNTHEDCHPYDYNECDYIYSQVDDKEKFEKSLKEAIKMIEKANSYTKEGSK